ncbi:MAG: carboxypeptidase M32 [Thermoflexales bacterium]|nr:carboxypeptidase M32 [Thermoflexales bacterium]
MSQTKTAGPAHQALRARLNEIADLNLSASILSWDMETHMPKGGYATRGEHLATLSRHSHALLTSAETRGLIDAARAEAGDDPDDDAVALAAVADYDATRAAKLPGSFVAERARAQTRAHTDWIEARKTSNFKHFLPALESMFDFARRQADYLGYDDHPYDALLGNYERGMKTRDVAAIFADLRARTLPLVRAIAAHADRVSDACVRGHFSQADQLAFSARLAAAVGYDFERGRIDLSAHPFAINFTRHDVRITTRVYEDFLNPCLFGTLHESGHAMYEQGTALEYVRTPLGRGASLGVHESQSRMWENIVGRSLWFWKRWYPELQQVFPGLATTSLETFYGAINKVSPSLIRVEADEVTYNFHIMLRFEIETGVLEGKLKLADMPEIWRARMQDGLGVTPPDDAQGCLQDIHWSSGMVGYFPTYSLGNLLSAQFFAQAQQEVPGLQAALDRGEYGVLLAWLRERIHHHGRKYPPADLVRRVTGGPISAGPYVDYLWAKFGALYGLSQ